MPKEDNKILKYTHGETSMNVPFIIYADLVFTWKISTCYNNPTKLSTTKINEHTFIVHTSFIWFNKNNLDFYRGKDCVKRFCRDLK